MALFEGAKRVADSRSFSRLKVSDGFAPAEQWITDPTLPRLFEYHYGGPGWVVIPKGTVVGVKDAIKDYETGKMRTVLSIADGTSVMPAGVAPYNIYEKVEDRFGHNLPTMVTRDYIEVPLMASISDVYEGGTTAGALKMKWGCAYGDLAPGDYVTCDAKGKMVKISSFAAGTFPKVVGQVLGMDTDMPPTGWLKYLDWANDTGERADDNNHLPTPAPNYPYNPDYKWPLTPDFRGIPGMTDGANIGRKVADAVNGTIASGTAAGSQVLFNVGKAPVFADSVKVFLDGSSDAMTSGVSVDETTGTVYVKVPTTANCCAATPSESTISITFDYHDLSYLGVPSAWDFKGAIGAARILLKF